jgi:hypothetical protein
MDTLLEHPFYSRIAFHALGRCKEESISAEMRMTMIRERIGKHFGWNTRLRYGDDSEKEEEDEQDCPSVSASYCDVSEPLW